MTGSAVPNDLIGDSWPRVSPGADPVLYGHATLTPLGAFEVRSFQTFTLSYTAGRFGIDDSGGIKVVFRFSVDWGTFQTTEPEKPNHVTARSSRGVGLEVRFGKHAHPRPWFQALSVRVGGGFLREGDRIDITLGDRSGGSPGSRCRPLSSPLSSSECWWMSAPPATSFRSRTRPRSRWCRGRRTPGKRCCRPCAARERRSHSDSKPKIAGAIRRIRPALDWLFARAFRSMGYPNSSTTARVNSPGESAD